MQATPNTQTGGTTEYLRKLAVAADMATDAYLAGGLDGMQDDLRSIYQHGDRTVVAEYERLYHRQVLRVADRGERYR